MLPIGLPDTIDYSHIPACLSIDDIALWQTIACVHVYKQTDQGLAAWHAHTNHRRSWRPLVLPVACSQPCVTCHTVSCCITLSSDNSRWICLCLLQHAHVLTVQYLPPIHESDNTFHYITLDHYFLFTHDICVLCTYQSVYFLCEKDTHLLIRLIAWNANIRKITISTRI